MDTNKNSNFKIGDKIYFKNGKIFYIENEKNLEQINNILNDNTKRENFLSAIKKIKKGNITQKVKTTGNNVGTNTTQEVKTTGDNVAEKTKVNTIDENLKNAEIDVTNDNVEKMRANMAKENIKTTGDNVGTNTTQEVKTTGDNVAEKTKVKEIKVNINKENIKTTGDNLIKSKEGGKIKLGDILDKNKIKDFLKSNPNIAKILKNKWIETISKVPGYKAGKFVLGKVAIPLQLAYDSLKDIEVFNESNPDFSGNGFSDIRESAKLGAKGLLDAGTNLVLNTSKDIIGLGDLIAKGLAKGIGEIVDFGENISYPFLTDENKRIMDENNIDYGDKFYNAVDNLKFSDNFDAAANNAKAMMKEFLYGKGDNSVYERTLNKYNEKDGIDRYGNKIDDGQGNNVLKDNSNKQIEGNQVLNKNNLNVNGNKYKGREIIYDSNTGKYLYKSMDPSKGIKEFNTKEEAMNDIDVGVRGYHLNEIQKGLQDLINKNKSNNETIDIEKIKNFLNNYSKNILVLLNDKGTTDSNIKNIKDIKGIENIYINP